MCCKCLYGSMMFIAVGIKINVDNHFGLDQVDQLPISGVGAHIGQHWLVCCSVSDSTISDQRTECNDVDSRVTR